MFNSATIKDLGFFLTVDQKYWEANDDEKIRVSKRRQDFLKDNYVIHDFLRKTGFEAISKFVQDKLIDKS